MGQILKWTKSESVSLVKAKFGLKGKCEITGPGIAASEPAKPLHLFEGGELLYYFKSEKLQKLFEKEKAWVIWTMKTKLFLGLLIYDLEVS